MERTIYQLEVAGETATLYLSSSVASRDLDSLRGLCDDLPRAVRTLRVDLHAMTAMNEELVAAMRILVRHWRASGRADVRLSFRTPHIVATFAPAASIEFISRPEPEVRPVARMAREAFTGAYI